MRQYIIPYGKILIYITVIIAMAAISTYVIIKDSYAYLIATLPVTLLSVIKLISIYNETFRRLEFVFNAVRNDDSSFRFTENTDVSRNAKVNYYLNRIKELLDQAKEKVREKERYFQLIMECANIGIVTVMENGVVAQTNSMALRILGIERLSHIDILHVISDDLCSIMHCIRPGENKTVKIYTEIGEKSLVLSCSAMELDGRKLRVISIGNIHEELDRKEAESWEKLTRILTHEIMNSLAPVTSISHSLISSQNDAETIQRGLETIHSTSDTLMRFIDSFRKVTRIPLPQKSPLYLSELVNESLSLVMCENIQVEVDICPIDTMVYADRTLMSQLLVNLLKNACEALDKCNDRQRRIVIASNIDAEERIHIEITNNGPAIPSEAVENIFTPFYTTKRDGSGIGLAVSRQIIRLHGGSLRLKHNEEGRVTFAIVVE